MYLRYIPDWARWLLPEAIYDFQSANEDAIYLTFDDGPIPVITEYILSELDKYNAKATFFCVGENVQKHPDIFKKLIDGGHAIGNHTLNHIDGYKTPAIKYYKNVLKADELINSPLFRPPYGRITYSQSKALKKKGFKLVLWSLLTADFDIKLSPQNVWSYIQSNIKRGDILVLHDNIKSFEKIKFVLPLILELAASNGWACKAINLNNESI